MNTSFLLLKVAAVSCLAACVTLSVAIALRSNALHRAYFTYVASLDRRLRLMFLEVRAVQIVLGQAAGVALAILLAFVMHRMLLLALIPVILFGPNLVLEHKRKQRVAQIELKLDGFIVALANALRASPSPGRALAMVQPVTPQPLDREIELVLREMRVGSTLEQALGNLSARVRSFALDAAMSGLLIGRQTGGNVPQILDGAANTLREITRLQGVLRAKTAEGRAQASTLAVFPLVMIFAFELARPGYFKPLTESLPGISVMLIAVGMWATSILMTRKIMQVQL